MIKYLTPKQQRVLSTIREFERLHNQMPSYKELADTLGYASINSIQQFVKVLAEKKSICFEKDEGIKSLKEANSSKIDLVNIPLVGHVTCGSPILAQENIEGYIPIDKTLIKGSPKDFFFLRAHGDSMNLAGIDDQDLLLVQVQSIANPGNTILVLIDDEATIKIFKPQKDFIALIPKSKNPTHKPIIVSRNLKIQGIVQKIIKSSDITI